MTPNNILAYLYFLVEKKTVSVPTIKNYIRRLKKIGRTAYNYGEDDYAGIDKALEALSEKEDDPVH